jgi:glycosyltransferase involved in cell wall biosynthesis
MAGVIHQGLDLSLVMVGSGDGFQEAQELARDLGLAEKVDFLGRQSMEKYAPILANAAIGLSPYCGWEEFSGLKIFDYKAAGLACIASGKDGQPATLRHGETGWIVPPCDEAALAEAIIKLACDVGLRRRLGQAARLDAEKFHTWTKTAESLEKIFNQLIQQ